MWITAKTLADVYYVMRAKISCVDLFCTINILYIGVFLYQMLSLYLVIKDGCSGLNLINFTNNESKFQGRNLVLLCV